MKKRILSIALVVAMIVVMIPAMLLPTAAIGLYDGYDGARVSGDAINVDANATPDAAYLAGEKIINNLTYNDRNGSKESSSFEAYVAADDYGFYFWISIEDASLDKGDGYIKKVFDPATGVETSTKVIEDASHGDRVQFYVKADAAGASTGRNTKALGSFGFDYLNQFNVQQGKNSVTEEEKNEGKKAVDTKGVFTTEGATLATTTNEKGWVAELYIPWVNLAHFDGADSGFEGYTTDDLTSFKIGIQVNNYSNDGKDAQRSYCYDTKWGNVYYIGTTNTHGWSASYNNSCYGGSRFVPVNFVGIRTAVVSDSITVDGRLDDAYLKSERMGCDPAQGGYENFYSYMVATVDGLYIYADIIDYTLDKPAGEVVDQGDKFQIYFQMGKRLSNANWGYIEMDYRNAEDVTASYGSNFRYANKAPTWQDFAPVESEMLHATTKKYDSEGKALGWTAEVFIPWCGEMALNGINEVTANSVGIMLQANDYKSTPNAEGGFSRTCNSLGYTNRLGAAAWYAYSGGSGGPSGNFYFAPIYFDFSANSPKSYNRWASYADSVTLDGVLDEAYSEYTLQNIGIVYEVVKNADGSESANLVADKNMADVYYAFTDTDVYVYVKVYDDTVSATKKYEYVSIYYTQTDFAGKWNLSPLGDFNTNSQNDGRGVRSYVIYDGSNGNTANLAIGTRDAEGYAIEYRMALTEDEKAALAAGKSVGVGIGVEVNNAKEDGSRIFYGYDTFATMSAWNTTIQCEYAYLPMVYLNKTLSEDNFTVTPEITGAQVALGESIAMNYYANLPTDKVATAKMQFTFNGEVTVANAALGDKANEYVFAFEGIAPQTMGDNIKAELIIDGEVVDTADNYSVRQNCLELVRDYSEDKALMTLIADLAAYGAAAQKFTGYKTNDLVNAGYEEWATPVKAIDDVKTLTQGDMIRFKAANVYFDNTNKIYAKVEIPAEALEMEGFAVTLNGAPVAFEATDVENEYIIYTSDILVSEFDKEFTFVVTDGDDEATLVYSVNAYCGAKLNAADANVAALAAATYAYGVSALAYAG